MRLDTAADVRRVMRRAAPFAWLRHSRVGTSADAQSVGFPGCGSDLGGCQAFRGSSAVSVVGTYGETPPLWERETEPRAVRGRRHHRVRFRRLAAWAVDSARGLTDDGPDPPALKDDELPEV